MSDITIPGSYISVGLFGETFTGLDITTIQPGELSRAIFRASRWIDRVCRQTLYGTLDTLRLGEDVNPVGFTVSASTGKLVMFPAQFPIRLVDSISYQTLASDTSPSTVLTTDCAIFPRHIEVDGNWMGCRKTAPPMMVNLAIETGWPVSTTSASTPGGAATAVLKSMPAGGVGSRATGLPAWLPGDVVEIQDPSTPEMATILSVAGNTVTFTGNIGAHAADTMIASPLLSVVQEANILVTEYLIKTKGIGPLQLSDESIRQSAKQFPEASLLMDAKDMLVDFTAYI
jgi:hypothetical protein